MTPPTLPVRDRDQLKMLAIMHYVWGAGLLLFVGSCVVYYRVISIMMVNPGAFIPEAQSIAPPPEAQVIFTYLLKGCLALGIFSGLGGALCIASAYAISRVKARGFSRAVAIFCLFQLPPVGTALGIFTLIVLARDSIRVRYQYGEG